MPQAQEPRLHDIVHVDCGRGICWHRGPTAGSAASARTRRALAKEEPPSLGEDSDTPALQEREATLKQVLDKLQQLGVTSPLETLKAAGLVGGPRLAAQRLLR